jgi:hypothetical protein
MKLVKHPMVKRIAAIVALCVIVLFVGSMFTEEAYAQDKPTTQKGDKKTAMKVGGVESALKEKEIDKDKVAKPWQKWVGFGSIPVMIIVVKFL